MYTAGASLPMWWTRILIHLAELRAHVKDHTDTSSTFESFASGRYSFVSPRWWFAMQMDEHRYCIKLFANKGIE